MATSKKAPGYETNETIIRDKCGFTSIKSIPRWILNGLRQGNLDQSEIIVLLNSDEFLFANYYGMALS